MKQVKLQQGDSFVMTISNKIDGNFIDLSSGEQVVIGFYDEYCNKYTMKLSKSNLHKVSQGIYQTTISHDVTKNFIGNIEVQVAIVSSSENSVAHAKKNATIYFEERKLNNEI